jgi:CheY-like chemotaxis protein
MAKILIIEDNEFVARMYQNILTLESYEVEIANSAQEGIEKAKKTLPTLILLDVVMPEVNGIQALEKLKADSDTKSIPVVMLTVIGEEEIINHCIEIGASGYLVKTSLDPNKVIQEVKRYMG